MRVGRNRNIRITVDPRGKIKTGYKGADGLPKKLDHFLMKHPVSGEVLFPELIEAYGEKPTKIMICFPSDNLEDVFNDDYNLWTKTETKRRSCNGELCTHVLDEVIQGKKYSAGSQSECVCEKHGLFDTEDKDLKKIVCKCDMYLKAYIFNPHTKKVLNPLPYLFSCHSTNSADNIHSMLARINKLKGIPFEVFLKKVTKNNRSFVIWNIVPVIITENLLEYRMDGLPEHREEVRQITESQEEIINEDTGEVTEATEANSETLFENFDHLHGHVMRLEKCTSSKSVDDAYAMMIKQNGLSKADKEFLLKATSKQKEFIREVTERENK